MPTTVHACRYTFSTAPSFIRQSREAKITLVMVLLQSAHIAIDTSRSTFCNENLKREANDGLQTRPEPQQQQQQQHPTTTTTTSTTTTLRKTMASLHSTDHKKLAAEWVKRTFYVAETGSIPKAEVYAAYLCWCKKFRLACLNRAAFGRAVVLKGNSPVPPQPHSAEANPKKNPVFAFLETRRRGRRGNVRYHYIHLQFYNLADRPPKAMWESTPDRTGKRTENTKQEPNQPIAMGYLPTTAIDCEWRSGAGLPPMCVMKQECIPVGGELFAPPPLACSHYFVESLNATRAWEDPQDSLTAPPYNPMVPGFHFIPFPGPSYPPPSTANWNTPVSPYSSLGGPSEPFCEDLVGMPVPRAGIHPEESIPVTTATFDLVLRLPEDPSCGTAALPGWNHRGCGAVDFPVPTTTTTTTVTPSDDLHKLLLWLSESQEATEPHQPW